MMSSVLPVAVDQLQPTPAPKPLQRTPTGSAPSCSVNPPADIRRSSASAQMRFDIAPDGDVMTVTIADAQSGEVVRKWVYRRGGGESAPGQAKGHLIDQDV